MLILATGCAESLPDRALVDDLRVLAVRADPPEARPGDTIGFDSLVADPRGAGRELRRAWAICTPKEGGVGSCGDPANVFALGTDLRATWTVPADLLNEVPEADRARGRDLYVVLGVEAKDVPETYDVAFKRIRVSTSDEPNHNPMIGTLLIDGESSAEPLVVTAGSDHVVEAFAAAGSSETWSGGIEEMRYTWLVSDGGVQDAVSFGDEQGWAQNLWTAPADPKDPPNAWVWVVARDGRGGIAWAVQPVIFQ